MRTLVSVWSDLVACAIIQHLSTRVHLERKGFQYQKEEDASGNYDEKSLDDKEALAALNEMTLENDYTDIVTVSRL